MENKTHDLTLSKIKQLVDVNGNYTNFEASFIISVPDEASFEAAVVDQSSLDNGNIPFKPGQGTMSGKIRSDKNILKNYVLVLRSDTPSPANVSINIQPLPDFIQPPKPKVEKTEYTERNMYAIGGVVLICLLALFFYSRRNGGGGGPVLPKNVSLLDKLKNLPLK